VVSILSPLALAISLLINGPALWAAFNYPNVDITSVLLRFVVVTVIVGIALSMLNRVWAAYSQNPVITMTPGDGLFDENGMPVTPTATEPESTVIQGENLNSTLPQSNAA
jgi:hypothetical protein